MKEKIISITFLLIIGFFYITYFFANSREISVLERRKLAQKPEKIDKNFSTDFDNYIVDQFKFRDIFINFNSKINRNLLNIKDNNGVYVIDNIIYDIEYPTDIKQIDMYTQKINFIIDNYLQYSNVYYSIIPDKSYFLSEYNYLKLDYNLLCQKLNSNIKGDYINIINELNIQDYYSTDIHWKQENLEKIVKILIENMRLEFEKVEYNQNQYDNFYGSSYSKAGIQLKPDKLIYLYNDDLKNIKVNHLEFGEKQIYDEEKLYGIDSYDVFLSGPSSLIELENLNAKTDKELIIFRDSFASSLIPVLTPYYKKITVIDLRYISFDYAKNIVEFENKDILFLHSTNIINNSSILKVDIK